MSLAAWLLACTGEGEPEPDCHEGYDYAPGSDPMDGDFGGPPASWGNAKVSEGLVTTELGEIDYSGGNANVSTIHGRDVDAEDDGEVVALYVFMSTPAHACDLRLRANVLPAVDAMSIDIESDCAGWPDELEDDYDWSLDRDEESPATADVDHRVDGNVAASCFQTELQLDGVVTLAGRDGTLTVNLADLVIAGWVYSYGVD